MKIAIIGTGIAGNVIAHHLYQQHDITVFEANNYIGGHTHTHDIALAGKNYTVDTGFIVFNEWTYPNFIRLLKELGVEAKPSHMSFSVKCEKTGLEYNGTTLNSLFAQRRNLLRPSFYRMLRDIMRFNKESVALLDSKDDSLTLGQFLSRSGYSNEFMEHYIIPMGSAIWSTVADKMFDFPACYFVRFFANHGMLSVDQRPQWYVVKGGSRSYVDKLVAPFRSTIRLNSQIAAIRRYSSHVDVVHSDGHTQGFDQVFLACHSDQALRLLQDPSQNEREILSSIPYQENEAILHTDSSVLPRRRLAWAAWNYHILRNKQDRIALSYNMNILQGLSTPETLCVTLNHSESIDPEKILRRMVYHHPMYTPAGIAAQARQHEINGVNRTYYCGAYWRYGFHEDGVVSALNALQHFSQQEESHAQLSLRRAS